MKKNTINFEIMSVASTGEEKGQTLISSLDLNEDIVEAALGVKDSYKQILEVVQKELNKYIDEFRKTCGYQIKSIVFFNPIQNKMSLIDTDKLD